MSARVAFAAAVAVLGNVAAAPGDHCAAAKSCDACVGSANCGWCQPGPIIWKNGSIGSRCGNNANKQEWECPGSYTTDKCTMGYNCNATLNYTCSAAGLGEGAFQTQALCQAGCRKPADLYKCDPASLTCKVVPPGTAGGQGQSLCAQVRRSCAALSTQALTPLAPHCTDL